MEVSCGLESCSLRESCDDDELVLEEDGMEPEPAGGGPVVEGAAA
jgi:hypothetical protein